MGHIDLNYMKRLITISLGIITSLIAFGQAKSLDFTFGKFDSISVDNGFEVTIMKGSENKVNLQVEAPYAQFVTAGVNGSTLDIKVDEKSVPADVKKQYKGKNPVFTATITMKEPLCALTLKGSSVLASGQTFVNDGNNITITVSDNAKVDGLKVMSKSLELKLDKKGTAIVDFTGEKVVATTSGGSNLDLTRVAKIDNFTVEGSSDFVVRGETEEVTLTSKGNSKSVLNGKSTSAAYTVGGTSNVNAINMENRLTSVAMNGLCTVTEAATDSLKVNLSAGSKLVFNNDPTFIIENVKASSIVKYSSKEK